MSKIEELKELKILLDSGVINSMEFDRLKSEIINNPKEHMAPELVLTQEDEKLIASLPYLIAYPLKRSIIEKHAWTKVNLLKDTFLNFLKYLGLLTASEFFNSPLKDKNMVALFQKTIAEPSFGTWNSFIRESLQYLNNKQHQFFCPELKDYYVFIETGRKRKLYTGEIEYIDTNGDIKVKKQEATAIGMLINFRNRYLGHGLTLDERASLKLWEEYFPIFRGLLESMKFADEYLMCKHEHGQTYLLHTADITTIESRIALKSSVWLQNKKGETLDVLPFFVIPGEVSISKAEKEQILAYESYTGKTIKFFSPEGTEKQTSGKILERLNLLLRDKQKEVPATPNAFNKEVFLARIADENKLLNQALISEKKVIPGIYVHRQEMEIKLREWIGSRASIFFISAEAGSGKTNLLVEMHRQYSEMGLPVLLVRAGRMEKQSLKEQIAFLLNIDLKLGLRNYTCIAGTQAEPTFLLVDGLNEAPNAETIWGEILQISRLFDPGSLKIVVTVRANSKADLVRYQLTDSELDFLYREKSNNDKELTTHWLSALNMTEMKAAWTNYISKAKSRFRPLFTFDDIATFDRGLYNQLGNPLVLRLFLETYNGKPLPKKVGGQLNIWKDWINTFSLEEKTFLQLLADQVWIKGENELLLDELLKNKTIHPYLVSDCISNPYPRLKNLSWISRYVIDLNAYIAFTVEGALLYLLGTMLVDKKAKVDFEYIQSVIKKGSKLQKSGIEAFLSEQASRGDLQFAREMIDKYKEYIDICLTPLLWHIKKFGVDDTLDKLLKNPKENYWTAFMKLNKQLEDLQLHSLRKELLAALMHQNTFSQKDAVLVGLNATSVLDKEDALKYYSKIDSGLSFIKEDADLQNQLGDCEKKFGNYDKALEYYTNCLDIRNKNTKKEDPKLAETYNNIGTAWKNKGDYDKALEYFVKSLTIRLRTLGEDHPEVAISYNNIGVSWKNKGNYDKALEYFYKALTIKLKILGKEHLSSAITYNNIGGTYKNIGDFDKALNYYQESLSIKLKILPKQHNSLATSYNNIGTVWKNKDDYNKALTYFIESLAIKLITLPEEHHSLAITYKNLYLLFNKIGDLEKGKKYYEKYQAIQQKKGSSL